jgi:penicillin-binding protein 1C
VKRRLILVFALVAAVVGTWHAVPLRGTAPPRFEDVRSAYCPSDIRVLDRHGAVLHELRVDPRGRRLGWTPLADISPALPAAVIASEDRRFYAHRGVDWRALAAALWQRLDTGSARGASTISMQVAALLDPALRRTDTPRTFTAKWRQMCAAWALEGAWTKAQILEAYLNLVTFRGELQGIGAAADVLYGKAPHGLTSAESVVLAALIRAPNTTRELLARRAGWGADAAIVAAVERAVDAPRGAGPRIALAPHAARRLLPRIGPVPCGDTTSTLDADTQRAAAEFLRRHLLAIRDRSARDGAVLVVDNASGDVFAYVGSSGDLSSAAYVDGIQAPRQAGSALKPFLYGLALDRHLLTAASLLDDSPLEVSAGNGLFRPRDYDEHFRGSVSVRSALAGSLNIPAVRALLLVGPDAFADTLRAAGVAGVRRPGDYYGPALALGAADVTLWQLVTAYRALANGGVVTPLHLRPGETQSTPERVFSAAAAFVIGDVLADRDGRSATFGLENPLATPFWTAVKTGTSKDMRDNWCVGFSRRYTVGVWVGNFSGEPMRNVSGITGAAPIWEDLMTWLHRDLRSDPPAPPPGVRSAPAEFVGSAEPPRREWYLAGTEPVVTDVQPAASSQILSPTDGSIIALDPDIPARRERIAFIAATADVDARWQLDGADLGPAAATALWHPLAGRHRLALLDGAARPLGVVGFEVRGGGSTSRVEPARSRHIAR